MAIFLTIGTALLKAFIDYKRWPFQNHWIGFVVAAVIVLLVCWHTCEIYSVFIYNVVFNPTLNLMKGLPFFYVGDTAWTDRMLKKIFQNYAGLAWLLANALALIVTI